MSKLLSNLGRAKSEIDPHYLLFMSFSLALFSSGFPIEEVIRRLGNQTDFAPYNGYFKRISNLISGYGFKISSAISNTIKQVRIIPFKNFLVRFSQSISYGDDPVEFLERSLKQIQRYFKPRTNESRNQ